MDNTHPEVITVHLGGKERRLKLGPAAFRRAELRGSTVKMGSLEAPTLGDLTHLVWVGLLPDEPTLDEAKVLGWLDDADEFEVIAKVTQALEYMATALSAAMDGTSKKGASKKK